MINTEYILTFGSFFRNGKYPLEADYIFPSELALRDWEENNRKYLHEGLLKVVVLEDKQVLYWYYNGTFVPVIESDTLENLAEVLKDFELHGKLKDIIRDFENSYNSKLKSLQLELDQTQTGSGLNGDGSFDELNMKNTTYLDGSRSIIECLKALDREMSNLVVDAFIKDAYYDSNTEEIVITFLTKQDKEKVVRISMTNLIREWEPDNTQPSKVVELTREEVYGGGADKLSADVRISSNKTNILEKDGNTLLVRGTSDNITHNGLKLDKVIDALLNGAHNIYKDDAEFQATPILDNQISIVLKELLLYYGRELILQGTLFGLLFNEGDTTNDILTLVEAFEAVNSAIKQAQQNINTNTADITELKNRSIHAGTGIEINTTDPSLPIISVKAATETVLGGVKVRNDSQFNVKSNSIFIGDDNKLFLSILNSNSGAAAYPEPNHASTIFNTNIEHVSRVLGSGAPYEGIGAETEMYIYDGSRELDSEAHNLVEEIGLHKIITPINKSISDIETSISTNNTDIDNIKETIYKQEEYKYVDLGLPSGTLWADRNIGATDIYDGGKLFQWGDPTPYDIPEHFSGGKIKDGQKMFSLSDYKWSNNGTSTMTKYNSTDGKTVLDPEDDAAHVNMGGGWRMPTREQFIELLQETTQELYAKLTNDSNPVKIANGTYNNDNYGSWTYINGYTASGILKKLAYIKLTSKTNGKFLIIPSSIKASFGQVDPIGNSCYCWFNSIVSSILANFSAFNTVQYGRDSSMYRSSGSPVRGILTSKPEPKTKFYTKSEFNKLLYGQDIDFNPETDLVLEDYSGQIHVFPNFDWTGKDLNYPNLIEIMPEGTFDYTKLLRRIISLGDYSKANLTDVAYGPTIAAPFPYTEKKIKPTYRGVRQSNYTNLANILDLSTSTGEITLCESFIYPGVYTFPVATETYYTCLRSHVVSGIYTDDMMKIITFNLPAATNLFGFLANSTIDDASLMKINAPEAIKGEGMFNGVNFNNHSEILEVNSILNAPKLQYGYHLFWGCKLPLYTYFRNFPEMTNIKFAFEAANATCVLVDGMPKVTNASFLFHDSGVSWVICNLPKCIECTKTFWTTQLSRISATLGAVSSANNMFRENAEFVDITFSESPTNLAGMFNLDNPSLKVLKLAGVGCNIDLSRLSRLNEEMIKYIVDHAAEGKSFTIKVLDKFFNEYLINSDLLAVASAKGITIAGVPYADNTYDSSPVTKGQLKKSIPLWSGTEAEFEAITKNDNTLYIVK